MKIYISLIYIKCLQFNILKHELVPEHSILNKEEEEKFKNKYNITENSELPEISYFDPVSLVLEYVLVIQLKLNVKVEQLLILIITEYVNYNYI